MNWLSDQQVLTTDFELCLLLSNGNHAEVRTLSLRTVNRYFQIRPVTLGRRVFEGVSIFPAWSGLIQRAAASDAVCTPYGNAYLFQLVYACA